MGEKLVIGPVGKGQRNDRTPFYIDNDNFPILQNAYQWRGRVKRKRGTVFLTRLTRWFYSLNTSVNLSGQNSITLNGAGSGNILSPFGLSGAIVPNNGSGVFVQLAFVAGSVQDDGLGNLFLGASNVGSINYATGNVSIPGQANNTAYVTFYYYPSIPVMGLEDFETPSSAFPLSIGFDTTYSYNVSTASIPAPSWDVSFYKNPTSGTYPSYVSKNSVGSSNPTSTDWNGQDYQQFWTCNYQGALWATNGITVPFTVTNIGMQFAGYSGSLSTNVLTYVSNTATTIVLNITNSPLVVGDFVFLNEFTGTNAGTLNYQTGYVTNVSGTQYTITLPNATVGAGPYASGIAQYLTNRSDTTKDCIRWYDGDPTNGANATPPVFSFGQGWVNFMPPLSQADYSLSDIPSDQWYLVGARMIFPFRDRLVFIGPVVQSSTRLPVYLQDTVIYSQNGTPYYTASFSGSNPVLANTVFNPILTPVNQTATITAYWEDQPGFGGWAQIGISEPINSASLNENVLILGMDTHQIRMVYTSNDLNPFNFYIINSELGTSSVFSTINMDKGVLSRGTRGFVVSSQVETQRFDLDIPDQVFEINALNNGTERICANRDFINEWVYFTFPSNSVTYNYPNITLLYNYRDKSWAQFLECYTTYGQWRQSSQFTWGTVGNLYPTWGSWNVPWNAGQSTSEQPVVIGGNQQGFVLIKDSEGTNEGTSLYISAVNAAVFTVYNHCLNNGDYIYTTGALGTVGTYVNSQVFSVLVQDANNIIINPAPPSGTTYIGNGYITRFYVPYIQTKQFPLAWDLGRKTRLGVQQYLLTATSTSQITLLIFLSQNAAAPYNAGPIIPLPNVQNNALIYSTVLYTCPESTNIGLTPANVNLQTPTAEQQEQIWHRVNTSLIGDTVQLGFTMSDIQMRSLALSGSPAAITGATNANPCVLTCSGNFPPNTLITISGVNGMFELNYLPLLFNRWQVITSDATTVTINVDSTSFPAFTASPNATAQAVGLGNQIDEIELHGIIIDTSPSQLLV